MSEITGGPPGDESVFPAIPVPAEAPSPPMLERLTSTPLPPRPSAQAEPLEPAWMDLLRNRFIIAGLGLVAVLTITAIVLIAIGSGNGDGAQQAAAGNQTPDAQATFVVRGGLPGRMLRTVSMRTGPGTTYTPVGTVPRQARVAVIGRDEASEWLQLNYPIGSRVKGWVQSEFVDVTGDIETLPIGAPSEGPAVVEPTFIAIETPIIDLPTEPIETPVPTEEGTPTEGPIETPTVEETPTTEPPPTETPLGGGAGRHGRPGNSQR